MGSPTSARADGLVRVTVASPTRRADLALPAAVPVAELMPELARSVGMLETPTVHEGHRLVTSSGRELARQAGLAAQGIEDGALLAVVRGVDAPAKVYDDVAEAMADVVERDLEPSDPEFGRRAVLTAAVLLAALGAPALVMAGSLAAGVAAAGVALCLVSGAVVVTRVRRVASAAVGLTWMAASYAAIAGFVLARGGASFSLALALAGGGAVIAGLACLAALGECRALAAPPVVVGAMFLATGSATRALPVDPAVVLTTALSVVVMTGSFVPTLALGVTGTMVDQLFPKSDTPVDTDRVRSAARVAHQIVVAASATTGLLLVLVAPFAVSLGPSGAALAVTCSLVVMLRTRRHRAASQVRVGLVSGLVGLLSVAGVALWLHPGWRPTVAVCLATAGTFLLAVTLLPSTPSVRRGRWCDLVESAALLATLPLLVVAVGVMAMVRG
jgi:type VII secretion integral membrane protein EccD